MDTEIDKNAFACRQALEALRSGVPNAESVKLLGCGQSQVESKFTELLAKCTDLDNPTFHSLGMLVSGDFGTGKSHLLSYLEHQALKKGFVCSRVAISKETPLYDQAKVFTSAIDNGRIPDCTGQLMEEIGLSLEEETDAYARFFQWANRSGLLHSIFPATLMLHERANDLELINEVRAFWSGERIAMAKVKNGLKAIGQLQNFPFKAPKARELPPQRLRFASELIKAAGYKGWVVLFDEIELVASYGPLQRARSYAELACWLGEVSAETCPGLVVAGTVTDDFATAILTGKRDLDSASSRLRSRENGDAADRAEAGMRSLEQSTIALEPPTAEDVKATVEKLRKIYSVAYGWEAPQLKSMAGGAGYRSRMRYKIRAPINEWDLLRLYPNSRPETVGTEFRVSYEDIPEPEDDTIFKGLNNGIHPAVGLE